MHPRILRFPLLAFGVAFASSALADDAVPAQVAVKVTTPAKGPVKPVDLPKPDVRLWFAAPTAGGLWTIRIDNEGKRPARIPADVRALHIEVDAPDGKRKKTFKCELPQALRLTDVPDRRALLLPPGESYAESFDPRLFCFGKNAEALHGGNTVRAYFGWAPPKWGKAKGGAMAVEPTDDPATFAAQKALDAPTTILSFDEEIGAAWTRDQWIAPNAPAPPRPPPLPTKPPELQHNIDHYTAGREARIAAAATNRHRWDQPVNIVNHPPPPKPAAPEVVEERGETVIDDNAPRLELVIDKYAEASSPERVGMLFKMKNVGKRPMLVAIRPRMIGLNVEGPDGFKRCDSTNSTGAVPREGFRTLRPNESTSLTVLLGEICPLDVFSRPGLYRVQATFDANESGSAIGLSAYTGESISEHGYVRLSAGPDPFYSTRPHGIPTQKLIDEKAE